MKRLLKPNGLGILFWLLLLSGLSLLVSASYSETSMYSSEWKSETIYAFGALTRSASNEGSNWSINWILLICHLAWTYILANGIAALHLPRLGFRRPTLTYTLVLAALAGSGTFAGVVLSQRMWGYWFDRPGVITATDRLQAITHVGFVTQGEDRKFVRDVRLVGPPSPSGELRVEGKPFSEIIEGCRKDEYYCLEGRLVVDLNRRKLLPTSHSFPSDLEAINQAIRRTNMLAKAESGYDNADCLRGVIVEGQDREGVRLVLVGLMGREVSNDHYPYYELAFTGPNLEYAGGTRFFYDVAGSEGMEWRGMALVFSVIATIMGLPIFTGFALLRADKRDRARLAAQSV